MRMIKKILATGEGSEYVSEIPIEGQDSLYYEIKKGHEYGDILLRMVANTLKEIFPEDCPVIRMGGDEFLILANETSEEKAAILIQKVQGKLKEKSKEKIPLSLAMGSYTINDGPFSIDEAISEADRKMYENKKAARK